MRLSNFPDPWAWAIGERTGCGVKHLFGGGEGVHLSFHPFLKYRALLIFPNPQSLLLSLRVLSEGKVWGGWALDSFASLFWGWRWEFSPQEGQGTFLHFGACYWE